MGSKWIEVLKLKYTFIKYWHTITKNVEVSQWDSSVSPYKDEDRRIAKNTTSPIIVPLNSRAQLQTEKYHMRLHHELEYMIIPAIHCVDHWNGRKQNADILSCNWILPIDSYKNKMHLFYGRIPKLKKKIKI